MKIYVAGRFQSYRKVRSVIDRCVAQGHEITYDWTRTDEFDENGDPIVNVNMEPGKETSYADSLDYGLDLEKKRMYANNDIQGVKDCDLMILCGDDSLAGAWVEFGVALAEGKQILVIKPERYTIFLDCEGVAVIQDYDVLEAMLDNYVAYGSDTLTELMYG